MASLYFATFWNAKVAKKTQRALRNCSVWLYRDNLCPFLFFVAKPTILTAEYHQTAMKIRIFTILIFIKICVISAQTILNVEY